MKKRFGARGQDAGNAATLVAIITLILLFYILFLPPKERAELLEEGGLGDDEIPARHLELLKITPGTLEFYPASQEHQVPSVHIYSRVESVPLLSALPFVIQRGWFTNKRKTIKFRIEDIKLLEEAVLSFNLPQHDGTMRIYLNNEIILESDVESYNSPPIEIPLHLIKQGADQNELEFELNGVGLAFWRINQYDIRDLKIIGNRKDVSRQESQTIFTISPTEKRNLLEANLLFMAVCDPEISGTLEVTINDKIAYSAVPDCNTITVQPVPAEMLLEGTNTLTFKALKGDYRIERVILNTDLKPPQTFIEYFEVPLELFAAVRAGSDHIYLEIDFVDDGERKRAELNVNGHITFIDQVEPFYTRRIDAWIEPGARNYIEITPESPVSIPEVRVVNEPSLPPAQQQYRQIGKYPAY